MQFLEEKFSLCTGPCEIQAIKCIAFVHLEERSQNCEKRLLTLSRPSDRLSLSLSLSSSSLSLSLSVPLSVCLSVCLSVLPSICLSLSVSPSFYLSVCLSVSSSVYLSVFLSVCQSFRLSVCLSVCHSVCPPVHTEKLCYHRTDFYEISYLKIFRNTVNKIQVDSKLTRILGTIHANLPTFVIISR
jgi:zinc transporter 9